MEKLKGYTKLFQSQVFTESLDDFKALVKRDGLEKATQEWITGGVYLFQVWFENYNGVPEFSKYRLVNPYSKYLTWTHYTPEQVDNILRPTTLEVDFAELLYSAFPKTVTGVPRKRKQSEVVDLLYKRINNYIDTFNKQNADKINNSSADKQAQNRKRLETMLKDLKNPKLSLETYSRTPFNTGLIVIEAGKLTAKYMPVDSDINSITYHEQGIFYDGKELSRVPKKLMDALDAIVASKDGMSIGLQIIKPKLQDNFRDAGNTQEDFERAFDLFSYSARAKFR